MKLQLFCHKSQSEVTCLKHNQLIFSYCTVRHSRKTHITRSFLHLLTAPFFLLNHAIMHHSDYIMQNHQCSTMHPLQFTITAACARICNITLKSENKKLRVHTYTPYIIYILTQVFMLCLSKEEENMCVNTH